MVIPPITCSCAAKECNECDCNFDDCKLNRQKSLEAEEAHNLEVEKEIVCDDDREATSALQTDQISCNSAKSEYHCILESEACASRENKELTQVIEELDYEENENKKKNKCKFKRKVDKIALKESCLNAHAALVEQELKNKRNVLAKHSQMSADKGKCLKENNEQVRAKMVESKHKACQSHFKCDKLACKNKCLRRKTKRK